MSEQNENILDDDLMGNDDHDVVGEENVVVNVNNNNILDMEVDDENEDVDEDDDEVNEDFWDDDVDEDDDEDWDFDHPLRRAIRRNEAEDVILQLIDLHPDVGKEIDSSSGEYLLHKACRYNSDIVVMKLMEILPQSIKQQNIRGDYPLHIACDYSQSNNVVLKLIELFPSAVQQHNNKGRYPLHIACLNDQSDYIVLKLIKLFPEAAFKKLTKLDRKAWNHGYALHMAINGGQSEKVIQKLIKLNPLALCERDCDLDYPIHCAIWKRKSTALIGLIMDRDPLTICRESRYGNTPLHYACHCWSYELMNFMIQKNSILSINSKTRKTGNTVLHCAFWHGGPHYEARKVETLLRYPDIDVNIRNNSNETPLHRAALSQTEMHAFEKLLQHPFIIINLKNNDNKTPLDLLQERKMKLLNRTTIPDGDDDPDENSKILKLQLYDNIEKLFEEFPVKRRWNAYCYFLNIP